jgi:hypothetical protein
MCNTIPWVPGSRMCLAYAMMFASFPMRWPYQINERLAADGFVTDARTVSAVAGSGVISELSPDGWVSRPHVQSSMTGNVWTNHHDAGIISPPGRGWCMRACGFGATKCICDRGVSTRSGLEQDGVMREPVSAGEATI